MSTRKKTGARLVSAKSAPTKRAQPAARAKRGGPAPGKKAKAKPEPAAPELVMERLERAVPQAVSELAHRDAWQLLVATILSAQSTDKTVNAVTPELFRRWPTPAALAAATQEEVEQVIKRTGFFRNKAKAIRGAAQKLLDDHGGEVPMELDQLIGLPGVARKTANVVLGTAFGIAAGFVVDTHVARVAQRLALSVHQEPAKIEQDLCATFPRERWVDMGHRVLLHGRYTCLAKNPMCKRCALNELCPSHEAGPEGEWTARADGEAERVTAGLAG